MASERVGYIDPDRGFVRVKIGFSWPAFLFGALWAMTKGLWLVALAMLVPEALIWFCSGYAEAHRDGGLALAGFLFQIGYRIVIGRYANAWWRARLVRQGYRPTAGVALDA